MKQNINILAIVIFSFSVFNNYCKAQCPPNFTNIEISVTAGLFPGEIYWEIVDSFGIVRAFDTCGAFSFTGQVITDSICLFNGMVYTFKAKDDYGDGWNGGSYTLSIASSGCLFKSVLDPDNLMPGDGINQCDTPDIEGTFTFTPVDTISGCTNPMATNYNPCALLDDASCLIEGCTDPAAINYDSSANVDNGSCTYPVPSNDNCNSAIQLSLGGPGVCSPITGTNAGATGDTLLFDPTCANYSGGDVWYYFFVGSSGSVTVDVLPDSGSAVVDMGMSVYSGGVCDTSLQEIECNDDGGVGLFPTITLVGRTPGEVIGVRVWEFGNDAFGTFKICAFEPPPPPVNDSCQTAIQIMSTCSSGSPISVSTLSSVPSSNSLTSCDGVSPNYDVWYRFTAPPDGFVSFSTFAGTISIVEGAIYDACGGNELDCFANLDGAISSQLTGGNSYYLQLWTDAQGTFDFCAEITPVGCTDPSALNYDSLALADDGSCIYPPCDSAKVRVNLNITLLSFPEEVHWILLDQVSDTVLSAECNEYAGVPGATVISQQVCIADGVNHSFKAYDDWGDGWGDNSFEIVRESDGCVIASGNPTNGLGGDNSAFCDGSDLESVTIFNTITVSGCTNPSAINYNPCATSDNGSCILIQSNDSCSAATFLPVLEKDSCLGGLVSANTFGATSSAASATSCDGTTGNIDVWYVFSAPLSGFVSPKIELGTAVLVEGAIYDACGGNELDCFPDADDAISSQLTPGNNYFLQLWTDDFNSGTFSLCIEEVPSGCTDMNALNYDPNALIEDGSCVYPPCDTNETQVKIDIIIDAFPEEMHWLLLSQFGDTIGGSPCNSYAAAASGDTFSTVLCLTNGDNYTFQAFDDWGDGWNGGSFVITRLSDGCVLSTAQPSNSVSGDAATGCTGSDLEFSATINTTAIFGCTDPASANYNPCANIDDGKCINNDICPDTTLISCGDTIIGTTVGASADTTLGTCSTLLTSAPGVWYSFIGIGDSVTIHLCGSSYDTKLGLFTGTCNSLVCDTGNDDNGSFCSGTLLSALRVYTTLGTTYYIYVSGFSTAVGDYVLTIDCPVPSCDIPQNLSANPAGQKATLTWDAVAGAVGYQITGNKAGLNPIPEITVGPSTSFTTGNDLSLNTTYYWKVRAICASDLSLVSDYSEIDTFMTETQCPAPNPISETNIMSNSADLNWPIVSGVVGYRISGKQVGTSPVVTIDINNPVQSSYTATGLSPNTSYQWSIQAFCTNTGFSPLASPSTFTTLPGPSVKSGESSFSVNGQFSAIVFPNPTAFDAYIQLFDVDIQSVDISILDISGKEIIVEQQIIESRNLIKLNTSNFAAGVYQIIIENDSGFIVKKLLLQ